MKFISTFTVSLTALAAATPLIPLNQSPSDNIEKRASNTKPSKIKNFFPGFPFRPKGSGKITSGKPLPTPPPISTPSWPKFGNGTYASATVTETSKGPTKTASPTKPTPQKPTPTSPDAIVSAIASDVQNLLNDIFSDFQHLVSVAGRDLSSIFGGSGFFKRDEAQFEKRDFNATEVNAALNTLVTNVFGHLVTLTNGTEVSLAQSFLVALGL